MSHSTQSAHLNQSFLQARSPPLTLRVEQQQLVAKARHRLVVAAARGDGRQSLREGSRAREGSAKADWLHMRATKTKITRRCIFLCRFTTPSQSTN